jgi:hypothetical protein
MTAPTATARPDARLERLRADLRRFGPRGVRKVSLDGDGNLVAVWSSVPTSSERAALGRAWDAVCSRHAPPRVA